MSVLEIERRHPAESAGSSELPADETILRHLAGRDAWFRYRKPRYQLQLIRDLASLLPAEPCSIVDIGAGSGVIGEAIAALLPGKSVVGIDIAANGLPTVRVPFVRFDVTKLPFADRSFDSAFSCISLHHVKPQARTGLLPEALRVTGGGPLIIKDHLPFAPLDGFRLWLLDGIGNAPRRFMRSPEFL